MDSMDPELASEMIKLLGQELKVVKAQHRDCEAELRVLRLTSATSSIGSPSVPTHEGAQALIAENDTLKVANVTLQERIIELQNELSQIGFIKPEEDVEVSTFRAREEFARLVAENQDLIHEKEEASRNQEKLSILHEKYQRMKARIHEYDEIMNELRDALSNCTQELEQTRKAVVTEIDFRDFLKNTPYEPVEGQLELSSIPSHDNSVHAKLCEDLKIRKGLYRLTSDEVIWSSSGIAFGLVIRPIFQYNPKHRGGFWTKLRDNFGEQMEVCYSPGKSSKTSRYLGTYERMAEQGIMTIAPETLQYLDHEKLDYVSRRTTLHQQLLPPCQTDMIKNMYKQGVIKLQCFGIRCVAVNQTFVQTLQDMNAFPASSTVPSPGNSNTDARKRKRDSNSRVQTRGKKQKGPLSTTWLVWKECTLLTIIHALSRWLHNTSFVHHVGYSACRRCINFGIKTLA